MVFLFVVFFSLFSDNFVLFRYCLVKRPFCTFLLVSLIKNFLSFLFYFLPFFGWEFSFFSFWLSLWLEIFLLFFFCFLPIKEWEFPFLSFFLWLEILLLSLFFLWLEIFLLFFFFDWKFPFYSFFASEGKDWHSHPGSRFMVSQDFGSRLVEWLDMIHVRVWFGSRIKGMPHIISMTQMQKWWFGNFMQNWSCMHLCGHSSVKFLWSCDARAQDSFPLF